MYRLDIKPFFLPTTSVVVVVVLTLTRIIKSVVTGITAHPESVLTLPISSS